MQEKPDIAGFQGELLPSVWTGVASSRRWHLVTRAPQKLPEFSEHFWSYHAEKKCKERPSADPGEGLRKEVYADHGQGRRQGKGPDGSQPSVPVARKESEERSQSDATRSDQGGYQHGDTRTDAVSCAKSPVNRAIRNRSAEKQGTAHFSWSIQHADAATPQFLGRWCVLRPVARRILVLNSHEAWVSQLGRLPIEMDIAVGLSGRVTRGWDERMRPVPPNARVVQLKDALMSAESYDVAVAHSVTDLLELKSLNIPKVFVIHTTLEGRLVEQDSALTARQVGAETLKYLKLIKAQPMSVSELKRRSWGIDAQVVGFSVDVQDYPTATCEKAQGLRISNLFNARQRILLGDFHRAVFDQMPIEIVGVNDDIPGSTPASDWNDLKTRISQSRFYIHTADPKLEDGYNMATVEAMASGLPVLGNRHPTSVVEHGKSGFLSDDPTELRRFAEKLLTDRRLALEMGQEARRRAAEVWSPDRFERGFLGVLKKARVKFHGPSASRGRPNKTPGSTQSKRR